MVTLNNKKTATSREIKDALSSNLNITATDSRFKTIVDKIADSRYRIKSLSEITLTNISSVNYSYILDGRVFHFATSTNAGIIEVRDYANDTLLTTINTGATQTSTAFTNDNAYIYIGCIKGTPKSIYIQRYNRCTLAYVDEYLLYQNDTPTFAEMAYRDGYIYCTCTASSGTNQHRIRKWNTTTLTTDVSVYFDTPLNLSLSEYGLIVGGRNVGTNSTDLQKPVILNYSNLLTNKLFPKTTLSQGNWRESLAIGNKLYIANDAGVVVKYDIDNATLDAEVTTSAAGGTIRALLKWQDVGILVANSFGYIFLYDFNLNLIKTYNMFGTSTTGFHSMCLDNNNTFYYCSYQYPKVFKKQFIDMTKDII